MRSRDVEKLLGGYATGTLTESERQALYAAALEDQTLFNAIADEEALKELLADPVARQRLLAALKPAAAPTPWYVGWRLSVRSVALLTCATAAVVTVLVVRRPGTTPRPAEVVQIAQAPRQNESAPYPPVASATPAPVTEPPPAVRRKAATDALQKADDSLQKKPAAQSADLRDRLTPPVAESEVARESKVATEPAAPAQTFRPQERAQIAGAPPPQAVAIEQRAEARKEEARKEIAAGVPGGKTAGVAGVVGGVTSGFASSAAGDEASRRLMANAETLGLATRFFQTRVTRLGADGQETPVAEGAIVAPTDRVTVSVDVLRAGYLNAHLLSQSLAPRTLYSGTATAGTRTMILPLDGPAGPRTVSVVWSPSPANELDASARSAAGPRVGDSQKARADAPARTQRLDIRLVVSPDASGRKAPP